MIGVLFKKNVLVKKMEPIRVLFYADTFDATSGYSKVGNSLAKRLAKDSRFDVYYQQLVGVEPVHIKEEVKILPSFCDRNNPLFINNIVNNLRTIAPEVFLPISDIFLMKKDGLDRLNFKEMVFMPYVLLDSINVPDYFEDILDKASCILAAHEFGQEQLKKENYESEILYHGVDPEYKPISEGEKINLRKKLKIPVDNKVFFFCGRNFLRKRPFRLVEAIGRYNKYCDDNNLVNTTTFLLHVSNHKDIGWNLEKFMEREGKRLNTTFDNVIFTKEHKLGQGLKEDEFVKFYQVSDFYISAASGEGFGLPIIEAMAVGNIVIAPDNTTHSQHLADNRGILVKNDSCMYVGYGTKQEVVNINALTEAIIKAVNLTKEEKKVYTDKTNKWVKDKCDWDKITKQLAEIIINEVNKNGRK